MSMNSWVASHPTEKVEDWVAKHGEAAMARHHTDDPYFALWMSVLNKAVQRRVMLHYDDLEDWDYAAAYEADVDPVEAAVSMLEDNGYDLEWR